MYWSALYYFLNKTIKIKLSKIFPTILRCLYSLLYIIKVIVLIICNYIEK